MIMEVTENHDITGSYSPLGVITPAGSFQEGIILLKNNAEYSLQSVFIMIQKNGCNLVVIYGDQVSTKMPYPTLNSAKSAFARLYNGKASKKNIKPDWISINPEREWLAEMIRIFEKDALEGEKYEKNNSDHSIDIVFAI
jgi:hypothetical protein